MAVLGPPTGTGRAVNLVRRFPEWPVLAFGIALAAGLAGLVRSQEVGARPQGPRPTLVVSRAAIERLREARAKESGAAAAAIADTELVATAIDEEILLHEGRALLEGGGDPVVRRRVEALERELAAGRTGEAEAAPTAEAATGLGRNDLVIRRYLIEAARLALSRQAAGPPPSDVELDAFAARDPARFAQPARLRFEHVFFGRDRHGVAAASEATALRRRLAESAVAPDGADPGLGAVAGAENGETSSFGSTTAPATALRPNPGSPASERTGDPFASGASFTGSPAEVERLFGADFARRLAELPIGVWTGPIESPFGFHVVRLFERAAPRGARLEAVRGRVAEAWRRGAAEVRLRSRLAELRAHYDVRAEAEAGSSIGS